MKGWMKVVVFKGFFDDTSFVDGRDRVLLLSVDEGI